MDYFTPRCIFLCLYASNTTHVGFRKSTVKNWSCISAHHNIGCACTLWDMFDQSFQKNSQTFGGDCHQSLGLIPSLNCDFPRHQDKSARVVQKDFCDVILFNLHTLMEE